MSIHFEQPQFIGKFLLERGIGKDTWELHADLSYYSWLVDELFVIPKGFVTDFASIPRAFHRLLPQNGDYDAAAVLHDWLYYSALTDRDTADMLFLEALELLSVPAWQRTALYRAVRLFGGKAWKEHRKAGHTDKDYKNYD